MTPHPKPLTSCCHGKTPRRKETGNSIRWGLHAAAMADALAKATMDVLLNALSKITRTIPHRRHVHSRPNIRTHHAAPFPPLLAPPHPKTMTSGSGLLP